MPDYIYTSPANRTRYQEKPRYPSGLVALGGGDYAWLVANGSWGEANAGLVVGDGESLLIETLWDVPTTREMLNAMASVTGNAPISTVVNTHADGDHFFGNQLVADKTIITSQASYDEMLETKPASMVLLGRVGAVLKSVPLFNADKVGHWFTNMVAPYDFAGVTHTPANQTFSGEHTLTIGGREVQLIEVGPAHTRGDAMVYVPDSKTLFAADMLFIGSTPVMWAGPIENWIAALDRILAMDVQTIVPGHGPLTDKQGVETVKAYWTYLIEKLRPHFEAGTSEVEAATGVVLSPDYARQPFGHWNSPERIMNSTHTLYRQWSGRTNAPKVPELLGIMRKQALLAHRLPHAEPQVMRKR
jgi:cyclase